MQPNLMPNRGKRLKGLDEFQPPEFVGRMERLSGGGSSGMVCCRVL